MTWFGWIYVTVSVVSLILSLITTGIALAEGSSKSLGLHLWSIFSTSLLLAGVLSVGTGHLG